MFDDCSLDRSGHRCVGGEELRGLDRHARQDGGTIVVVKPREAFLRYFQTADELARRREKKRGVESGSDEARTR